MLPVWPNTDRIPVWVWLLAVAAFFAVGLLASQPGFDAEAAILRVMQGIAAAVIAGGLFWMWHGGRALWRLQRLRHHGVQGEAAVVELGASTQMVKRSGPFAVGRTPFTQHFLSYRLTLPTGDVACGPMRIDGRLAKRLRKGGSVQVRYLPNRPTVSAPEQIAVLQVKLERGLQFAAGLALVVWSAGWLAPGAFWPEG